MNTYTILLLMMIGIFFTIGVTGGDVTSDRFASAIHVSGVNPVVNESDGSDMAQDMTVNESSDNSTTLMNTDSEEIPEIYNGTEHPNDEIEVRSSTPSGDPFIPRYAQGGFITDFYVHTMEGRGNDTNVSATLSVHDHTSVFGYVKTLQKDFHYVSSVEPEDRLAPWY